MLSRFFRPSTPRPPENPLTGRKVAKSKEHRAAAADLRADRHARALMLMMDEIIVNGLAPHAPHEDQD